MSYLFASDYDGTLFHHDIRNYRQEDLEAIRRFQKEGNYFGICTGRGLDQIRIPVEELGGLEPDFYIAASGAVIWLKGKGVVKEEYIPYPVLKQVYEACQGWNMYAPLGDTYLSFSDDRLPWAPEQPENARIEDFEHVKVDTFSFEFDDDDRAHAMYEQLKPVLTGLDAFINMGGSVDVVCQGQSKGRGVKELAAWLHIPLEQVGVMGDSYNDISMLEAFPNSYAFPHCPQKVRLAAAYEAGSVAQALDMLRHGDKNTAKKQAE